MALEKKNLNIPISGGVNQGEDSYLLKPPYLDVVNGWYDKEGSIRKRGAYQFIQAGFSASAVPFVLKDRLHVLDGGVVTSFPDPQNPKTSQLNANAIAVPVEVTTLPSTKDGALEVVTAVNGTTVMVVWSQPVAPDPDATDNVYKKHLNLYAATFETNDLSNPTAGPFVLTKSGTPVDMEEISVVYTGGFWCITGIDRTSDLLESAVFASLTTGALTWQLISTAEINHYDITFSPGFTALYYVIQYQNDTSSTTIASRSWGYTEGVSAAIGGGGTLSLSRATLGVVGVSDNYVGDKAVAIHVKGSVLWYGVASERHDNLYVYTTNTSLGSKSAATLVHTHVQDEPWVNGNFAAVIATPVDRAYPQYEEQNSVVPTTGGSVTGTDFGGGNDRVGRLCIASTTTGVRFYWDGPIITDVDSQGWGVTNPGFWPSLWGVAWKEVTDGLSVGSSLGAACSSFLGSKPLVSGNTHTLVLGMSTHPEIAVGNFLGTDFGSVYCHKGVHNPWWTSEPDKPGSWRMGQLCRVSGTEVVPISQFGADLLVGREWGLKDAARLYEKGTNEPPQMSTRRMNHLFESGDRDILFGATYLIQGSPALYERPGNSGILYNNSMDAHLFKGVVARFRQDLSPRSQVAIVDDEVYLANGWLSVFDGANIREASPNFIPPSPVEITASGQGDYSTSVSWFVVNKDNNLLRTSVSSGTATTGVPQTGAIFNAPPSFAQSVGGTRFEIWLESSGATSRVGVGDPARFSSGGPWVFRQRLVNGTGGTLNTQGLSPEPVGGASYVATTSNRIWYIEPEDTARVRFSKDFSVLGRVEFNRNLYVDIPDGSKPVAVASLDEQVVILTDKSIYLVTGNLPNNNGGGANFYLQRVAFEGGCSNRYSVFSTRQGVFFESERGLNLLTRGYEVLFAGEAIEDSVSGGSSITGTAYLPAHDLYLFTTSSDIMALRVGQSFKWTRWDFEHDQDIVASCAWGDYHVVLGSDGDLFYMDMDVVTDVLMILTTPWIYLGDLEGFQRVRNISLVGRNDTVSPAGYAAVQIGYDFATSYAETLFYEYGVDITGSPLRIRMKPARGKCSSFRLRFAETAETVGQSTTNDAAITIAGISVEAGIKMLGIKNPRTSTSTPS